MNTRSKAEKFWDRLASRFDRQSGDSAAPTIDMAGKYLRATDTVLDFGCATGTVSLAIADRVARVRGIDISAKMVEIARQKSSGRTEKNISFEQATIFDENLEPGSFDAVLAYNILHLLEDPERVLERIYHLLKPGGRLISLTVCMGERTGTLQTFMFKVLIKLGLIPEMNFFKLTDLETMITREYFQMLEKDSVSRKTNCFIAARKKE